MVSLLCTTVVPLEVSVVWNCYCRREHTHTRHTHTSPQLYTKPAREVNTVLRAGTLYTVYHCQLIIHIVGLICVFVQVSIYLKHHITRFW